VRIASRCGSRGERPVSYLLVALLCFGGLFPTAFALAGQFLPHWLLALGSCRNGAPGFLGVLLRFSFNFVFGELKLCGLHNDDISYKLWIVQKTTFFKCWNLQI
jgi:hypothetical protein